MAVSFLTGCNKDSLRNCEEHAKTSCNQDINKTNIRILNNSEFDMCNVTINPAGEEVNYGIISTGAETCYRTFDLAYAFSYITFDIGNDTFTFTPEDFTGEQPLGIGKFTYTVNVPNFADGNVTIAASKD